MTDNDAQGIVGQDSATTTEDTPQEIVDRAPSYAVELVTWLQTYFTQIEECCTSKGVPRPPNW